MCNIIISIPSAPFYIPHKSLFLCKSYQYTIFWTHKLVLLELYISGIIYFLTWHTSFTQHCIHAVHLGCSIKLESLHYLCLMIFHYMTLSQFTYLVCYKWIFGLFPGLGYYEQCCFEHVFWWTSVAMFIVYISRCRIAGS